MIEVRTAFTQRECFISPVKTQSYATKWNKPLHTTCNVFHFQEPVLLHIRSKQLGWLYNLKFNHLSKIRDKFLKEGVKKGHLSCSDKYSFLRSFIPISSKNNTCIVDFRILVKK